MALIFFTAVVYFFIGEMTDAIILGCSIVPIMFFEFLQERRTDQAISALDKMVVENCHVYRDGAIQEMAARLLLPGDLIYLTAGDRVPADAVIINSPGLQVDESMLTGESVAVVKTELPHHQTITKEDNILSQGTLVVGGEGYAVVEKIGSSTAYGKLGDLLQNIQSQKTPLQQKIHHLVLILTLLKKMTNVLLYKY